MLSYSSPSVSSSLEEPSRGYGWPRLLLCFLLPGLLAKAVGRSGRHYMRAFVLSDLSLLVANTLVDHGPREGIRRLPEEAGLWPPKQRRHSLRAWAGMLAVFPLVLAPPTAVTLASLTERASRGPAGRLLNWRPISARWSLSALTPRRLLFGVSYPVLIEECYIHGLLWSRMAWLGRWRPIVNALAWAFYHLNRPVKDMVAGILPGALVASYFRAFTGNIYWTALGHYLSNAFYTWLGHRNLQRRPPSEEETSTMELIAPSQ